MSSSFNVPKPPPMAIKLSGARTLTTFRTVPSPVIIATVKYGLHSPRSSPGAMPTTIPPNERAPFEAAFITPLIPPETQIAPERAISRPTSSAHWIEFVGTASVVAAVPSTPIMGTRIMDLLFSLVQARDSGQRPSNLLKTSVFQTNLVALARYCVQCQAAGARPSSRQRMTQKPSHSVLRQGGRPSRSSQPEIRHNTHRLRPSHRSFAQDR